VGITGRGGAPNEAAEGGGGGGAAGAAVAAGAVAKVGCSPRGSSAAGRSLNRAAARSSSDGFSSASTAFAASRASRALSSRSPSTAASAWASASAAATSAAERSPHYRHPARAREALHLVPCARARIRRQHDAPQSVPLQLRPHPRDPHDHPPGPEAEAQQPDQPVGHAGWADVSPPAGGSTAGPGSSSPPSSIISFKKVISLSASSGVMAAILSTSSRSKSRMSWSVFLPARSSRSTSSTGKPLSSRSDTLVAASSSGGSGANSGPSPPRSSHSRREYRSIFQPASSGARRT